MSLPWSTTRRTALLDTLLFFPSVSPSIGIGDMSSKSTGITHYLQPKQRIQQQHAEDVYFPAGALELPVLCSLLQSVIVGANIPLDLPLTKLIALAHEKVGVTVDGLTIQDLFQYHSDLSSMRAHGAQEYYMRTHGLGTRKVPTLLQYNAFALNGRLDRERYNYFTYREKRQLLQNVILVLLRAKNYDALTWTMKSIFGMSGAVYLPAGGFPRGACVGRSAQGEYLYPAVNNGIARLWITVLDAINLMRYLSRNSVDIKSDIEFIGNENFWHRRWGLGYRSGKPTVWFAGCDYVEGTSHYLEYNHARQSGIVILTNTAQSHIARVWYEIFQLYGIDWGPHLAWYLFPTHTLHLDDRPSFHDDLEKHSLSKKDFQNCACESFFLVRALSGLDWIPNKIDIFIGDTIRFLCYDKGKGEERYYLYPIDGTRWNSQAGTISFGCIEGREICQVGLLGIYVAATSGEDAEKFYDDNREAFLSRFRFEEEMSFFGVPKPYAPCLFDTECRETTGKNSGGNSGKFMDRPRK